LGPVPEAGVDRGGGLAAVAHGEDDRRGTRHDVTGANELLYWACVVSGLPFSATNTAESFAGTVPRFLWRDAAERDADGQGQIEDILRLISL